MVVEEDIKDDEDKQLFSALEYLDSIKKSDRSIGINELLKAFVIGKIINNESEHVFLGGPIEMQMFQLMNLISAVNFDINDKPQVDTCKFLLSSIKQAVLLNKSYDNNFSGFVMAMANMESSKNTSDPSPSPISQKQPAIQEIDQKIYKKALAFDKLVEALRPILDELTN